jgi:hypothetical protein
MKHSHRTGGRSLQVVVLLDATDAMTSQTVEARHAYQASDIVLSADNAPGIIRRLPNGKLSADYTCFWERSRGLETIQEAVAEMEPLEAPFASVAMNPASVQSFRDNVAAQQQTPKEGRRLFAATNSESPLGSTSTRNLREVSRSQSHRPSFSGADVSGVDDDFPRDGRPVCFPSERAAHCAHPSCMPWNIVAFVRTALLGLPVAPHHMTRIWHWTYVIVLSPTAAFHADLSFQGLPLS